MDEIGEDLQGCGCENQGNAQTKTKLIPEDILKRLKPIYATQYLDLSEIKVPLKLFSPSGCGTWYIWEFDGEDLLFGICELFTKEIGYVSLKELENLKIPPFGLRIERDLYWDQNTTAQDIMDGKVA